ncbi:hypothetical protein V2J09_005169 [Rumex salicifolius]
MGDGVYAGLLYTGDGMYIGLLYTRDGVCTGEGVYEGLLYTGDEVYEGFLYTGDGVYTGDERARKDETMIMDAGACVLLVKNLLIQNQIAVVLSRFSVCSQYLKIC